MMNFLETSLNKKLNMQGAIPKSHLSNLYKYAYSGIDR